MTGDEKTIAIGPRAYADWRATALGAATEALEQRLMFDLLGALAGARVLDIGCGDGALVRAFAALGATAVGVDPDPAMLSIARKLAEEAHVQATFLQGRAESLPFPDASFDVATAMTVLCFIPDAKAAVREMARVVRPGGRLVLGELGRWSFWAAKRRLRGRLGAPTWKAARFRDAAELRKLAEAVGLKVTAMRGAVFYPPLAWLARLITPIDSWLGRRATVGAAFIALAATREDI
ncbi:class I SAM-dependent methyltransferase [Rhodoblastus sp.]|uniref:class I SAM-dependent methyltransferase n=1 Tax=Rhodoblastus sp. TaxID=1962975 RepID=UPI0026101034|nr:class I SAM-dependent methyltransferase [Rhodoblastus sp.]